MQPTGTLYHLDSMALIFQIGVAWLFCTYYLVFLQTRFYGHLLVSLAAFLNLASYMFLRIPQVALSIAILSKALFVVGISVTATVGMNRERERLRTSSWSEIFGGVIPQRIRVNTVSIREQVALKVSSAAFLPLCFILRKIDWR